MKTTVLSIELILFIALLSIVMRYRKSSIFSISIVQGLILFVPPIDSDFEELEKTDKPVKTNMKGEPKKSMKSIANKKARFPLRTMQVDKEVLTYTQEFFETYDFILIMFVTAVSLFVVTSVLQVVRIPALEGLLNNSLPFYVLLMILAFVVQNLLKNTFSLGYLKLTDEAKMEFLMAFKAFMVVFCTFKNYDSSLILPFSIDKIHLQFVARINQAVVPFGV